MLGITIIWGTTFVIIKNALGPVGPLTFLALLSIGSRARCSGRPALVGCGLIRSGMLVAQFAEGTGR
jgi:hypothetical protein